MCIHQEERAKHLSKFAVATLHASSVLSQQFRLTREQVDNAVVVVSAAAVVVVVVVVFVVAFVVVDDAVGQTWSWLCEGQPHPGGWFQWRRCWN